TGEITAPGQVSNTGVINAERGVVILNGDLVTNGSASASGVIRTDTSITRNGQIFLDARLKLTLANGSIQILPAENGETIPVSALSNFAAGQIEMRGYTVDLEPGALVEAPGATVTVSGLNNGFVGIYPLAIRDTVTNQYLLNPARVYMGSGSAIDVSGLQDVN